MPYQLATELRDRFALTRAVETGTYWGGTTRALAGMFPSVVTVELSDQYFANAQKELADLPHVVINHGSSPSLLRTLRAEPTLYWLDAHWSGLDTAGVENPCPVLDEISAIPADPADCLLIDDARLFATTSEPDKWPTLVAVIDALRAARPGAHVTVIHDLILCVPARAKDLVDAFGTAHLETVWAAGEKARTAGSQWDVTKPAEAGPGRLAHVRTRLLQVAQRALRRR